MKTYLKALFVHVMAAGLTLAATDDTGQNPFAFTVLEAGARAAAMGGSIDAVPNDANAMQYNPAALATLADKQVTFMRHNQFEDIDHNYVGVGLPSGWGASISHVDLGKVQRTTRSNPQGIGLDSPTGEDWAVALGYGREIYPYVDAGGAVKYLQEELDGSRENAAVLDVGLGFQSPLDDSLRFTTSVQNIRTGRVFQTSSDPLPITLRFGVSDKLRVESRDVLWSANLSKRDHEDVQMGFGVEINVKEMVFLRGGYQSRIDAGAGLSVGAGIRLLQKHSLDYSFLPAGELGSTHRFSFTLTFGSETKN